MAVIGFQNSDGGSYGEGGGSHRLLVDEACSQTFGGFLPTDRSSGRGTEAGASPAVPSGRAASQVDLDAAHPTSCRPGHRARTTITVMWVEAGAVPALPTTDLPQKQPCWTHLIALRYE